MGKRVNEQESTRTSRLRVFYVELDGSDATITEALRAVERLRRPTDGQHAPKQIGQPLKLDKEALSDEPSDSELVDQQRNGDDQTELALENEPLRQKRGQGPKKDRNAGIQLVGNLDFVPQGKPSLKDFFAEKAPRSDMDQILVLSYYLQHMLEVTGFGPGHILSGFKHVEKPVPVDLKKTIRNMKTDKAWLNFSDIENLRVTTEGENRVEHKLGKPEADAENEDK